MNLTSEFDPFEYACVNFFVALETLNESVVNASLNKFSIYNLPPFLLANNILLSPDTEILLLFW